MIGRCHSPSHARYADYGGRGIAVCDRWRGSLLNFLEDMGRRPSPDHSLDRVDNNGPYSPDNCRWATREEQGRNKRNNVRLTLRGRTQTITEWARELGVGVSALQRRRLRGWSHEEILTTPIGKADSRRRSESIRRARARRKERAA